MAASQKLLSGYTLNITSYYLILFVEFIVWDCGIHLMIKTMDIGIILFTNFTFSVVNNII